jgi:hypothetical protein
MPQITVQKIVGTSLKRSYDNIPVKKKENVISSN